MTTVPNTNDDVIAIFRASTLPGDERDAMLTRWIARVPVVAAVFDRTPRVVPVVRLAFRRDS